MPPDATPESDDLAILLTMIYVAWADERLTRDELALIVQEASDQGLDEAELVTVQGAITEPPTCSQVAERVSDRNAAFAAMCAGYAIAYADKAIEFTEIDALDSLARELQLTASEHARVREFAANELRRVRAGDWRGAMLLEDMLDDEDLLS